MINLISNTREKQIEQLKQVKKSLQAVNEEKWKRKYKLAKVYYEHHHNLEIPIYFKTINGYDYDEKGVALGNWIYTQRQSYNGQGTGKITEEQIELLKKIEMRFEIKNLEKEWNKKYKLAKAYYEHYGDLDVSYNFKTLNGYNYDENGIMLRQWINKQKQECNEIENCKLNKEQIELLKQIGVKPKTKNIEEKWNKKYELAKAYYERHGNLKVPTNFKTLNGYEYDENGVVLGIWLATQRQAYKGRGSGTINEEQIKLLNQIEMKWFSENINIKLQKEEINEKNINRKKIELYNRFMDYASKYKNDKLPSKEELNSNFIEELDRPLKR